MIAEKGTLLVGKPLILSVKKVPKLLLRHLSFLLNTNEICILDYKLRLDKFDRIKELIQTNLAEPN